MVITDQTVQIAINNNQMVLTGSIPKGSVATTNYGAVNVRHLCAGQGLLCQIHIITVWETSTLITGYSVPSIWMYV